MCAPDLFPGLRFIGIHRHRSETQQKIATSQAEVMEQMRCRPDAGRGDESIRNQFEFVKICCDVSELDLTDFFDKWGFFWVGEITVSDYRKYRYKITQKMVDETKAYITKKKYKKPSVDITLTEE